MMDDLASVAGGTSRSRHDLHPMNAVLATASGDQLRALVEMLVASAPIGIGLVDRDLRFVAVNKAFAARTGVPTGTHVGCSIQEIFGAVDDDLGGMARLVWSTGKPIVELPVDRGAASDRHSPRSWSLSMYRVESDAGEIIGVALILVDGPTTGSRPHQFRGLIDALGSFAALLDVDGRVLEANEHALTTAGLAESEVIGLPFWETFWWSHDPEQQRRLRTAITSAAAGETVRYDAVVRVAGGRLVTIDFQIVPLVEEGEITGLVPSGVDVTDRRAATSRLRALGSYAQALAVAATTDDIAEAVVSLLPGALDAGFANLALLDADGSRVTMHHPPSLPPDMAARYSVLMVDRGIPLTDVIRNRRTVILPDEAAYRADYPELLADTRAAGLSATASVPLVADDQCLGSVGLGWMHPLETDETLGSRLDVVAELTAQTLRRTRAAEDRAALITELQRYVLPDQPRFSRLNTAVRYQAAGRSFGFGGDWYDIIVLDEARTALVVGDVAGHGIEAAARMTVLRTSLNAVLRLDTPLGDVFDATEKLVEPLGESFLGTAIVAIVDTHRRELSYSSAGHPPLIVKRPGHPAETLEGATRPVLGLGARGPRWTTVALPEGSVVVTYTDGLVERRREPIDAGIMRVAKVLDDSEVGEAPIETLADDVLASAGAASELTDDVAFIVARLGVAPDRTS